MPTTHPSDRIHFISARFYKDSTNSVRILKGFWKDSERIPKCYARIPEDSARNSHDSLMFAKFLQKFHNILQGFQKILRGIHMIPWYSQNFYKDSTTFCKDSEKIPKGFRKVMQEFQKILRGIHMIPWYSQNFSLEGEYKDSLRFHRIPQDDEGFLKILQ